MNEVYIRYNDSNVITFIHRMPFDKVNGLNKSRKELEKDGVFVTDFPSPEYNTNMKAVAKYNPYTNSVYYEYEPIAISDKERLDYLEAAMNAVLMGGMEDE